MYALDSVLNAMDISGSQAHTLLDETDINMESESCDKCRGVKCLGYKRMIKKGGVILDRMTKVFSVKIFELKEMRELSMWHLQEEQLILLYHWKEGQCDAP